MSASHLGKGEKLQFLKCEADYIILSSLLPSLKLIFSSSLGKCSGNFDTKNTISNLWSFLLEKQSSCRVLVSGGWGPLYVHREERLSSFFSHAFVLIALLTSSLGFVSHFLKTYVFCLSIGSIFKTFFLLCLYTCEPDITLCARYPVFYLNENEEENVLNSCTRLL